MEKDVFYDTKKTPVTERESFNNTILLLTLIKSQYYYMIGFSRPEHIIRVGFDYHNRSYGEISEELEIDFCSSKEYVVMRAVIENANIKNCSSINKLFLKEGKIHRNEENFVYEHFVPKDNVLPIGVQNMNEYILEAKQDIESFLDMYYLQCTRS